MEVYIPDFNAGPDIEALIREFVGEEQELWFYYRKGCETWTDVWNEPEPWEDVETNTLKREMLDAWIADAEKTPAFVRQLYFSIEDSYLRTDYPGNMEDFPELLEDFYKEFC